MKLTPKDILAFRDNARRLFVDRSVPKQVDKVTALINEDFVALCHIQAALRLFQAQGLIASDIEIEIFDQHPS